MTSKDILFQIKLAMLYKDINLTQLAEETKIQRRTLQNKFYNPDTFTITDIIKIAEILDIRLEFIYPTVSIQPLITPTITPNTQSGCESCWWYQQQKANPNFTITVGDTPCTWCPKMQPTCIS